ncbi:glutamate--tRNA ligase [Acetobacterium woodii]|uniref:Glutamate--tRNA ligase n=1 Tax=Acetobacterium woodii (strain ATCC 29683 / DSM 1030 / JCM 2381 / KCTC 1655 / WB1) TaxID=931626 RepID=H6LC10_ACEWD|nr:glutamate--tRNA ligase [Acetobacterium woodii]AFA48958.1 glutamyl-tRNA synthetase (glutamate--tRNA ligase) [Acetobacterium woodii DSM 1030]
MVRDRFAPSPTGNVHIGSLRTALYNYLYAKKMGGEFLLRLEDTDQTRLELGAVDNLLDALNMTGVIPDEGLTKKDDVICQVGEYGPYIQSQRLDIYRKYIDMLLENGQAYYCFCTKERLENVRNSQKENGETPRYDGKCRTLTEPEIASNIAAGIPYTIRLKLPEDHVIRVDDMVRGVIEMNTNDLDDQVLLKADGFPTYHMAVVVDDHLMKITHVIRGEEWLPSTPKHVYLYECLGWQKPQFVHLPNILNDDRKKLSKRQGDVSVGDFLAKGYLPEALVNFLALLGWSPETEQEIFSIDELIQVFDLNRINKSGAVFDRNKLNWMNAHYIKQLKADEFVGKMTPFLVDAEIISQDEIETKHDWLLKVAEILKDRIEYFAQAPQELEAILKRFDTIEDEEAKVFLKEESSKRLYQALITKIEASDVLDAVRGKAILKEIQKEEKIKGKLLFMPSRIMITGEMHGPDLTLIMDVLGKDEVLSRIKSIASVMEI